MSSSTITRVFGAAPVKYLSFVTNWDQIGRFARRYRFLAVQASRQCATYKPPPPSACIFRRVESRWLVRLRWARERVRVFQGIPRRVFPVLRSGQLRLVISSQYRDEVSKRDKTARVYAVRSRECFCRRFALNFPDEEWNSLIHPLPPPSPVAMYPPWRISREPVCKTRWKWYPVEIRSHSSHRACPILKVHHLTAGDVRSHLFHSRYTRPTTFEQLPERLEDLEKLSARRGQLRSRWKLKLFGLRSFPRIF